MATIKVFEDLESWQLARKLCKMIHVFISREPFSKSFKLRDQIDSSSGSVMNNIAEGFERNGRKEFIQFLAISKGLAGETMSQLYKAFDRNFISNAEFTEAYDLAVKIGNKIGSMMNYLGKTEYAGTKYKVEETYTEYLIQHPDRFFNIKDDVASNKPKTLNPKL